MADRLADLMNYLGVGDRQKAGQQKMSDMRDNQAQKQQNARDLAQGLEQGKIKVQRTIQTGKVQGSEAYGQNPENIVIGKRTKYDIPKQVDTTPGNYVDDNS